MKKEIQKLAPINVRNAKVKMREALKVPEHHLQASEKRRHKFLEKAAV